ncbi:MAG TPA: hypothetical protein VFG76_02060, partial [Candidatus Polarisedimenticolia bacterium]|nr:hypothetical protein [Candidatus Polarisedimenticolia bacterium]
RTFSVPGGSLKLDVEILNLTNRSNVCCIDDFALEPLANGSVDVEPQYNSWLGVTPSAKLIWEF